MKIDKNRKFMKIDKIEIVYEDRYQMFKDRQI